MGLATTVAPPSTRRAAAQAADRRPEGLLYALAVRSLVACGTNTALDPSGALAVPGVVAAYIHENAAETLDWRLRPAVLTLSGEALGRTALAGVEPEPPPPYRPLGGPEIVFVGQWIAVIKARDRSY